MDYLDPDIEHDYERECPKCGHSPVSRRDCTSSCEDGYHDDSEDDFMLPGSVFSTCSECNGHGHHYWCSSCGYDLANDEEHLLDTERITDHE